MITLYRRSRSKEADEVKETLEELVLAHRVVEVDGNRPEALPEDGRLPVLVEGGDAYSGDEIASVLDELRRELGYERQFSADACFVDPDHPGRCV
jgi:hypothetical protein